MVSPPIAWNSRLAIRVLAWMRSTRSIGSSVSVARLVQRTETLLLNSSDSASVRTETGHAAVSDASGSASSSCRYVRSPPPAGGENDVVDRATKRVLDAPNLFERHARRCEIAP